MIGKQLLGIMLIMTMMIVAVLSEGNDNAATAAASAATSTLEIYTPMENSDKSSVSSQTIVANSTITPLYNYQYISAGNLAGYAWNYYYMDVYANTIVSLTHMSRGGGSLEILLDSNVKPTAYSYAKKATVYTYQSVLKSDSKTYYHRIYIAVRNINAYTNYGYTLSVSTSTAPTYPTNPTTTTVYRTNNTLALGLGVPSLIITIVLFIVVISLIKKNKALTNRVEQLEKKLIFNMPPVSDQEMMPVMMNVPLMSANTLQQDHEEIQQQIPQPIIQPPTNAVPEQQPTTIPQFFPQFVQQHQLPPQFRNAQPYPFAYPPQVVFAQPPHMQPIVQQQQQQQTGAQAKQ